MVSLLCPSSGLRSFLLVLLLVEFVAGLLSGLPVFQRWHCSMVLLEALIHWYSYYIFKFFGKDVGLFRFSGLASGEGSFFLSVIPISLCFRFLFMVSGSYVLLSLLFPGI